MPDQVLLCATPAGSGIVCTPAAGTGPASNWRWLRVARSGSFSRSVIASLGPIPIKFVLLGDLATCRPGFNDGGVAVPCRRHTGVSPSTNYLAAFINLRCRGGMVNHQVNKKNIRGKRFC